MVLAASELPLGSDGHPRRYPKDRRFETTDGASIAYTVLNVDGPSVPVVLVPGLSCTDTYVAPLVPGLVDGGHPVLILDNRGHFDSTLPRPAGCGARNLRDEHVSVARFGLDVVELLDDAGIDRAAIAGHSLGVQILFEVYRAGGPDRVAALIPIAGTHENPIGTFAGKDLNGAYTVFDRIRPFLPLHLLGPALRPIASPRLGVFFATRIRAAERMHEADIAPHVDRIHELDFGYLFRLTRSMWKHSAADLLPDLAVPLLVCSGEKDVFTPPAVQHAMVELAPVAELLSFPEGSHFLPVDHAQEISAAMVDFLARHL